MDQGRICGGENLRREAKLFQDAGPEIVQHGVGRPDQREEVLPAARRLQIERHALLSGVVGAELGAVAAAVEGAERIASLGILDLDDLGPQLGEQLPGERPADETAELQDAERGQRCSHCFALSTRAH
jgi:hypothetical protein